MDFESSFPMRVCMNLDRRPDRWEAAQAEFWNAGLKVDRWRAVDGKRLHNTHGFSWPSRYGVSLTKRMVVRAARQRQAEAVFIFEDDAVLHPEWRKRAEEMELPEDWGMFFLGCQHLARPVPVAPGLVRVVRAADNHAIGIRRNWYERVLFTLRHGRDAARIWPHTASDRHLAALMEEVPTYAAWPNLAWQRKAVSDQTGKNYTLYDANGLQYPNRHLFSHLQDFWKPSAVQVNEDTWLCEEELTFLRTVMQARACVLEYGSSGITGNVWEQSEEWHCIEYEAARFHRARGQHQNGQVRVHYAAPEWSMEHRYLPAQAGQFKSYTRKCLDLGCRFDVVILDGRARVECALAAAQVMNPGAWLFFHDYYARSRYQRRAGELLPHFRLVKSFRHTPQTMAVFRRTVPV